MKIEIKGKFYETGKLAMIHAIEAMGFDKKIKNGEMTEVDSFEAMIDILAQSIINGTEKIPYDEIDLAKKEQYIKLIKYNLAITDIEPIYANIVQEMTGKHSNDEGK